ncbi:MAG TPA: hypothetical protein VK752_32915 [Bryobacteraceae bacterium]|nr:hypothetical protein [Bryobacteraceae bacterium]
MHSPELIWDGELDSGSRGAALVADLGSSAPPEGVSISLRDSHAFIEIATRSWWALATWVVSALMIWFGLTSDNWFLLVLSPFMMGAAIMQSFGRICILIRDQQLSVFEGVGGIGKRRAMPLSAIRSVEYAVKRGRGGSTAWIVIHADRDVKFGRHLNGEQIHFVIAFLLDATRSME